MVQVQEEADPKMLHPYKVVTNYESMFSDLPQYPSHSYVPVRGKYLIDWLSDYVIIVNESW